MAFGGSSFGGIAALVAGMKGAEGCGFGSLLIESPSLWIGEPEPETFLKVRRRGGCCAQSCMPCSLAVKKTVAMTHPVMLLKARAFIY